jgi:hypothetical protein
MLGDRSTMVDVTPRQALTDALRYWEPRRILYNGALAAVVTTAYVAHLPASRNDLTFNTFEGLFVLAVLANAAYCAAYPVDLGIQLSAYRALWLRARWLLLVIGVMFGAALTHFFSLGIFGSQAQ